MKPPYTITPNILSRVEQVGEAIGRAETAGKDLRMRRSNRIRAIRGSLAIEGNILSDEQVAAILEGKPVVAPLKDVQEARNAIRTYNRKWDPGSEGDLLRAHRVLMEGFAPGRYRRTGVTVAGGGTVHHIGPPPGRVPQLMANLFAWLNGTDEHPLITSSVFHYEFEFIHPFEDGNGRIGRLWQTLILTRWKRLFAHVPVESLIHARQNEYYEAIRQSSAKGESTPFIEFMLDIILQTLRSPLLSDQAGDQESDQVARLLAVLRKGPKTAAELMAAMGLSHRPSFRRSYIRPAMSAGLVDMTRPESPTAKNQRYRITERGKKEERRRKRQANPSS